MYTVRHGMFETNSSSMHTITIDNQELDEEVRLPNLKFVSPGEFGWDWECYDEPEERLSYLWTAVLCLGLDKVFWMERFKELLGLSDNVTFDYGDGDASGWSFLPGYYIDHVEELISLMQVLQSDDDLLRKLVLGKGSFIETGNDNEDAPEGFLDDDEEGRYVPDEDSDVPLYRSIDGESLRFYKYN